jgi:RHS repeat-associated protein
VDEAFETADDRAVYNYNARWYDPATGHFISQDPLGAIYPPGRDANNPNLYRYAGNNPLNATDPTDFFAVNLL